MRQPSHPKFGSTENHAWANVTGPARNSRTVSKLEQLIAPGFLRVGSLVERTAPVSEGRNLLWGQADAVSCQRNATRAILMRVAETGIEPAVGS